MAREAHGLVEACEDERLLGFLLWPRQRELLSTVEAGPWLHVWALGRRSGKTTVSALVGLWDCLLRPDLRRLVRPGERRYSVAVATNQRQARLFVAAARSVVERSPLLARQVETVTDDEILFRNGTALAAFPCTSRGARGWPISTLLLDEAAHMIDTEGNQAAEQVYRALVPSTAQFGDAARVIVASTPFGTDGLFAELHQKVTAGELDDAAAVQATSAEMNPTLDSAFLSREHARDPEGFRGEYLAEFVGSGGAYIDPNRLREVVTDRGELDRLDAEGWVLGLDLGFTSDPTAAVLVGRETPNRSRLLVGLVRKWTPRKSATFEERRAIEDGVLADVAEIAGYYGGRVIADQYVAPQVESRLAALGVRVSTLALTATSKSLAFAELRARINAATIQLHDDPDLLADLRGLRTQRRAGSAQVVTPHRTRPLRRRGRTRARRLAAPRKHRCDQRRRIRLGNHRPRRRARQLQRPRCGVHVTEAPSLSIVVAVEAQPRIEIRVGDSEWPATLDWLTQPQVRAALLRLVELLSPEP